MAKNRTNNNNSSNDENNCSNTIGNSNNNDSINNDNNSGNNNNDNNWNSNTTKTEKIFMLYNRETNSILMTKMFKTATTASAIDDDWPESERRERPKRCPHWRPQWQQKQQRNGQMW